MLVNSLDWITVEGDTIDRLVNHQLPFDGG